PPLANCHRTAPVAAFNAYIYPCGSSEHPNTTPFAVVTGPEVLPPLGGAVCHRSWPVTASRPLHIPVVTIDAFGIVHGFWSKLAFAVYTRLPSTADPHCRPPA